MSSEPDKPPHQDHPSADDPDVRAALTALLALAESLSDLPLDQAVPAFEPPRWE